MLKVGDTIKCADKEDLLNTYNDLALNGVYTDFLYEKGREQGLWLIVEKIRSDAVKAILVIEMPENCLECPIGKNISIPLETCIQCSIGKCVIDEEVMTRPDWCPLKELPDKITSWKGKSTNYQQGHRDGYNACIDEILGDKE